MYDLDAPVILNEVPFQKMVHRGTRHHPQPREARGRRRPDSPCGSAPDNGEERNGTEVFHYRATGATANR